MARAISVGTIITTFPATRRLTRYDYLFFTYAGSRKDKSAYGPDWFHNLFPPIVPIGWISPGEKIGRGLALGTSRNIHEFKEPEKACLMIKTLMEFYNSTGAKSIALGGQLPSVLAAAGTAPAPPFVSGQFGTIFILYLLIGRLLKKRNPDPGRIFIGILGVGFIGSALVRFLSGYFHRVIAVDIRKADYDNWPANVTYTTEKKALEECDMVVILTGNGDDAKLAIKHMKKQVIVLDDSHPQLSTELIFRIRNEKNGAVFKAAVAAPGVRFNPRLPGFNPEWIPGCAIEAMVAARFGHEYKTQEEFNTLGVALGFKPLFVTHRM